MSAAVRVGPVRGVRVRRVGSDAKLAALVESFLAGDWDERSDVLKSDGAVWVRSAMLDGGRVVIKCRPLVGLLDRSKAALGMGKGARHWRGAELLRSIGVDTAEPILLSDAVIDGVRCELMVMQWVEGRSLLEVFRDIDAGVVGAREQHRLAEGVGRLVGAMVSRGVFNRDHKPSNLIVSRLDRSGASIAVIDCEGVRRRWKIGLTGQSAHRMLASLIIEPTGCGVAIRRTLMMRALRGFASRHDAPGTKRPAERSAWRAVRRQAWESVRELFDDHPEKRPRVNPLGGG